MDIQKVQVDRQEFLAFMLGNEKYGVDILKVQEIRDYQNVTPIPNTPAFIKGVINLRGAIVPVFDMRLKFNLPEAPYDQFTVVIILNILGKVAGIVVDSVSDVVTLTRDQISPPPDFGSEIHTEYLVGVGNIGEQMLLILDMDRLMSKEEIDVLHEASRVAV
ncbi:chemotaxis protein CheW [Candidatus Methylospira mobilis]|uniref:Chemotaxis protein CheW n=1 Tax=Candidatus Methylospira mobilis TaxID=1808979 RepID=A0A5Q0BJV9_9GAMM|nr:chemotaxis protein CheW [Candidatus Methylospira mobilis]QFY42447.1 chemotaxis protein CheW [Candidatus Methylospira mobilis]WNV04449.1 chemotaxis protein CheW [Candidatus Methylospira mobilis]